MAHVGNGATGEEEVGVTECCCCHKRSLSDIDLSLCETAHVFFHNFCFHPVADKCQQVTALKMPSTGYLRQ
ncbi:hypothetical protein PAMP_016066 [Pampus punctatissimus]